jgi:hypothetical protein
MMIHSSLILAVDDSAGKIIAALVVFAFWGIGSLASMMKKQQERERRQRGVWQQAQRPAPPPRPPAAAQRAPAPRARAGAGARAPRVAISEGLARRFPDVLRAPQPAPPGMAQRRAGLATAPPRLARRPGAPPAPAPAPPRLPAGARGQLPSAGAAPPADSKRLVNPLPPPRQPVSADAAAIARWLRPASLRQQFILTEVFQPPLAFREEREL